MVKARSISGRKGRSINKIPDPIARRAVKRSPNTLPFGSRGSKTATFGSDGLYNTRTLTPGRYRATSAFASLALVPHPKPVGRTSDPSKAWPSTVYSYLMRVNTRLPGVLALLYVRMGNPARGGDPFRGKQSPLFDGDDQQEHADRAHQEGHAKPQKRKSEVAAEQTAASFQQSSPISLAARKKLHNTRTIRS